MIADDRQDEYDRQQRSKLGMMVMTMGAGILFMALIPNPLWGRLIFFVCAMVLFSIGALLKKTASQAI